MFDESVSNSYALNSPLILKKRKDAKDTIERKVCEEKFKFNFVGILGSWNSEPFFIEIDEFICTQTINSKEWVTELLKLLIHKDPLHKSSGIRIVNCAQDWIHHCEEIFEVERSQDLSLKDVELLWKFIYACSRIENAFRIILRDESFKNVKNLIENIKKIPITLPKHYVERTASQMNVWKIVDIEEAVIEGNEVFQDVLDESPPYPSDSTKEIKWKKDFVKRYEKTMDVRKDFFRSPRSVRFVQGGNGKRFTFNIDDRKSKSREERLYTFVDYQYREHLQVLKFPRWFYKDKFDMTQGPFETKHMRKWWKQGMLKPETLVRTEFELEYVPISERFCCFVISLSSHSPIEQEEWISVFLRLLLHPKLLNVASALTKNVVELMEYYINQMDYLKKNKKEPNLKVKNLTKMWKFFYSCEIMSCIVKCYNKVQGQPIKDENSNAVFRFFKNFKSCSEEVYQEKNGLPLEVFGVRNVENYINYIVGLFQKVSNSRNHVHWQIFIEEFERRKWEQRYIEDLKSNLNSGKGDLDDRTVMGSLYSFYNKEKYEKKIEEGKRFYAVLRMYNEEKEKSSRLNSILNRVKTGGAKYFKHVLIPLELCNDKEETSNIGDVVLKGKYTYALSELKEGSYHILAFQVDLDPNDKKSFLEENIKYISSVDQPIGWLNPNGRFSPVDTMRIFRTSLAINASIRMFSITPFSDEEVEAPHGVFKMVKGIPILNLWGEPADRGFSHGYLLGKHIIEYFRFHYLECYIRTIDGYNDIVRKAIEKNFRITSDYLVEIQSLIKGIEAQNCSLYIPELRRNMDIIDLLAMNCLHDYQNIDFGSKKREVYFVPKDNPRFSFFSNTEGKKLLIAANFEECDDMRCCGAWKQLIVVINSNKKPSYNSVFSFGWPGLIGTASGFNDKGVFLFGGNSIENQVKTVDKITPTHFYTLHTLECYSSVQMSPQGVSMSLSKRIAPPQVFNYLICRNPIDCQDKHYSFVVEIGYKKILTRIERHRESGSCVIATGHFLVNKDVNSLENGENRIQNSLAKYKVIENRLQNLMNLKNDVSVEDAKSLLQYSCFGRSVWSVVIEVDDNGDMTLHFAQTEKNKLLINYLSPYCEWKTLNLEQMKVNFDRESERESGTT